MFILLRFLYSSVKTHTCCMFLLRGMPESAICKQKRRIKVVSALQKYLRIKFLLDFALAAFSCFNQSEVIMHLFVIVLTVVHSRLHILVHYFSTRCCILGVTFILRTPYLRNLLTFFCVFLITP